MKKIVFILIIFLCSAAGKPQLDRNFSLQKLENLHPDNGLKLVDSLDYIYVLERQRCLSSEYYHYAIIDTTNYNSYVYFYFKDYVKSFVLVNYDKSGKYIDDIVISSLEGDGGYFYHSNGIFVNDSVIIRTDTEGGYDEHLQDAKDTITREIKLKIVLKKDGHILTDTLQYLKNKNK